MANSITASANSASTITTPPAPSTSSAAETEEAASQSDVISGRCLCGSVSWSMPASSVSSNKEEGLSSSSSSSQILICHCSYCRRQSGSTHIPWMALPRAAIQSSSLDLNLATTQHNNNNNNNNNNSSSSDPSKLSWYRASEVAQRGFCNGCGSTLFMDYHGESHSIWVAMGTLDSDRSIPPLHAERDNHIFYNATTMDPERWRELSSFEDFGTYRPDPCQPTADGSWRDLPTWQDIDTMASFVASSPSSDKKTSLTKEASPLPS